MIEVRQENTFSLGLTHGAAISKEGRVVCWGSNAYLQCEVPVTLENVVAVSCGYYHTAALVHDGSVVCWGYDIDTRSDFTVPPDLEKVIAISSSFHMAAVTESHKVVAWGRNTSQQCNVPPDLTDVLYRHFTAHLLLRHAPWSWQRDTRWQTNCRCIKLGNRLFRLSLRNCERFHSEASPLRGSSLLRSAKGTHSCSARRTPGVSALLRSPGTQSCRSVLF
jgi:hypothetical protein